MTTIQAPIVWDRFHAVLFDLDGVITATAKVHAACWKRMFDEYRLERLRLGKPPFRAFEVEPDYRLHVDGKPRTDGVRSFLESRGILLPPGAPDSPPDSETLVGLGKRKDLLVQETFATEGVEVYPGTVEFVKAIRARGLRTAVVSSSRNAAAVLRAASIADEFDVRVDGEVAARLRLPGKPAPDTFLHAAAELGASPARCVVVEDAIAGVQSGRAGGFGLVVGIDREGNGETLKAHGADLVVSDLGEFLPIDP